LCLRQRTGPRLHARRSKLLEAVANTPASIIRQHERHWPCPRRSDLGCAEDVENTLSLTAAATAWQVAEGVRALLREWGVQNLAVTLCLDNHAALSTLTA